LCDFQTEIAPVDTYIRAKTPRALTAAENGNDAEVRLLEHKADVDGKTMGGNTALYLAAENGHEAVVQLLLKHMADVGAKDNDERTATTPGG
jgi:ankyrin repeat protein